MGSGDRKTKTSLGLDENLEAALSYVLGWVTGLIFFLLEKDDKFVRFHALQSLITFLAFHVIAIFFGVIPLIGWAFRSLISIAGIVVWIVCIIKAYQGEKFKLPIVGDIAEKNVYG
ncbi:MAG: DUF4870 domain-containing protein [Thermoproteota archaeon]